MGITVARNAMVLLSSSVCARFLVLGFNIVLARILGVEQFGVFAFAVSYITLMSAVVEFSLQQLIVRDVAQDPELAGSYFSNALALKCCFFLLALGLLPVTTKLMNYSTEIQTVLYILSIGLLFNAVTNCCIGLFNAMQQMRYSGALGMVEEISFTAFGLLTLVIGGGLTAIVCCRVVAQGLTQFVGLMFLVKRLGIHPEPVNVAMCQQLVKRGLPFFGVSLFTTTGRNLDTVLLLSIQGPTAAGIYAAGAKLVKVTSYLSKAFSDALYPVLSKQSASQRRERLEETYGQAVKWIMITVVPFVAFAAVQSASIMRTVYGQDFVEASIVFQIFAWHAALGFFTQFCGTTLYALGRQIIVFIGTGSGVIISLILYAIFIPQYSYTGAAYAALVGVTIECCLQAPFVDQRYNLLFFKTFVLKPVAAGLVMLIFCVIFEPSSLIVSVALASLVYVGCLLLFGVISREEIEILVRSAATMLRGTTVREV